MKTNAPRAVAVIGGVALIAAAFGLGYYVARPHALRASPNRSEAALAVPTALAKPNELERVAGVAPILASLDAQNLDAVVGAYEATFTSVGPGVVAMELLCEAWSKIDPAGAVQRIRGWRDYWRNMALPLLMRSWARRDRAAARAVVETIEPAELQETAATAVILGWADSGDPALWDEYVAGLPFGRAAVYNVMQRIGAREGVDALLRRAESVPEDAADRFRQLAFVNAVDIAAQTEPERAAAFAEQHRGSAGGLEVTVATRWAASNGPRAMEWALSRPTGRLRDRTLQAAFESWLWSDEEAAFGWAEHQPDEVLAGVADLYANRMAKHDLKRALEISKAIANPTDRRQIQLRLARNWFAQQPEIAAPWLEQNGLADLVAANRATPKPETVPDPPIRQPGGGKGE